MTQILVLVGLLVLLTLLRPVLRLAVAAVFGRSIGARALAQTPDAIHLSPAGASPWRDAAEAGALCRALTDRGFEAGGTFVVDEMPGVVIALFADPVRSFWAAVYDHPRAGRWIELVTRYVDGTTATYTTLSPTGLAPLPGHIHVHVPRTSAAGLLVKAESERPRGAMKPSAAADAARAFVEGYAEGMARRKRIGVSKREVVAVAKLPRRDEQPVS